jgi:mono/diheme cytochrome c family protein
MKGSFMKTMVILLSLIVLLGMTGSSVFAQDRPGDSKRGNGIYQRHCLQCHGIGGGGDGPEAAYLTVPPANLLSNQSRLKSDFELYMVIAHGSIYSPMHGWRDRLQDHEIWDVLEYIRFLAPFKAIAQAQ